ncbi:CmpA/NrtA family ABC transporter substrate-binding protein [Gloeobacter kilaueensis]|uniref:ABC-type nitrate/sulfonate/bicarbonate transport systems, periplasmic component n=1 Tax=Gloeobacter kilaueensis (strain ATCC BAA-2537 / CCAP 1431/1 / ULC 316 / JS1) TaxID=1183438 RepID=U5QNJ6_GLOK1|nr:CmpA/NrtA family ABC transporter substrate-binding protein [Gloeobacter kilaueensis]AGY60443.1 ABC-type nitrate/sulfonate/bicarbonate transport systems, periplasmic component [Gloeobacter kilaueensis JS1]
MSDSTQFTFKRRDVLISGAAAAGSLFVPGYVSAADAPETPKARLGFIALSDCAPLVIAKEKGYFDKYGMKEVEVLKQASWGVTRDNLELGADGGGIDGAHLLTPMAYLISNGNITKGNKKIPLFILARLNVNGQAISVANKYKPLKLTLDAAPMKQEALKARSKGDPITVAQTFPGGTHWAWLRYWLAAGGVDPETDVKVITVPPPQMVANMKTGVTDAFCVGEPWNQQLINQQIGYSALTTGQIWNRHPEKSFVLRADYVEKYPKASKALLMAIQEAQIWADKAENKDELAQIVSKRQWIGAPVSDIVARYKGIFDYGDGRPVERNSPHAMQFWQGFASYPYRSHDLWFLTEDIRWGMLPVATDTKKLVAAVNREDLWREAAKGLGQPVPKSPSRGVEKFFDGISFDPNHPEAYLKSVKLKKLA